jgi:hypothetical protein
MKDKGLLQDKLDAQTYRHGFSMVGDIDILMCNDSFAQDRTRREVDIVKMETVKQILDEAKREFPKRVDFPYETTIEAVEDRFYLWFKKWFGVETCE